MKLTLDEALKRGIEAHKTGKFQEADRFYTAVLKVKPKHPDANHNMGVLAVGIGKVKEALPFLKIALEANPNMLQYRLSYIEALIKIDCIDDARSLFEKVKDTDAESDNLNLIRQKLGISIEPTTKNQKTEKIQLNILDELKLDQAINLAKKKAKNALYEEAERIFRDILQKFPKNKKAIEGMKALPQNCNAKKSVVQNPPKNQIQSLIDFHTAGKLQLTLNEATKLLSEFPNSPLLYNIIGTANKGLGKLKEAIHYYDKAIAIKPNFADAQYNMANTLKEQGRLEEAVNAYNKTLSLKPDYANAYSNMGIVLKKQGKLDEAIEAYNKAIAIKPNFAEAYNNIGNTLQEQGKLDEAIEAYNKAIAIKPNFAEAYNNVTEILKMHTPENQKSHILFINDKRIKEISAKLFDAKSDKQITKSLIEALNCVSKDKYRHETQWSQIYKQSSLDLNCNRHKKIFQTRNIIPKFCFECLKVQVEVDNFIDLIKLTTLFYKFDFKEDLTRKTMIELRPYISGFYKGLIYCRGLNQAQEVKDLLDSYLINLFDQKFISTIKRGCSEFSISFPEYGKVGTQAQDHAKFPPTWESIEKKFDQSEKFYQNENVRPSLTTFCLSDFYIIQKWIDYAKGISDPSVKTFDDRPIIYQQVYREARKRIMS